MSLWDIISAGTDAYPDDDLADLCEDYGGEHYHSGGGIFLGLFNDGPEHLIVVSHDCATRWHVPEGGPIQDRYDRVLDMASLQDPEIVHEFKDPAVEEALTAASEVCTDIVEAVVSSIRAEAESSAEDAIRFRARGDLAAAAGCALRARLFTEAHGVACAAASAALKGRAGS